LFETNSVKEEKPYDFRPGAKRKTKGNRIPCGSLRRLQGKSRTGIQASDLSSWLILKVAIKDGPRVEPLSGGSELRINIGTFRLKNECSHYQEKNDKKKGGVEGGGQLHGEGR